MRIVIYHFWHRIGVAKERDRDSITVVNANTITTTGERTIAPISATITAHGVIAENGVNFELLGNGMRYGLDSTYAVREAGSITAPIRRALSRGWPWQDEDVWIV